MNKIIKTNIDGVPVDVEVEITNSTDTSVRPQIKIIRIGENSNPTNDKDTAALMQNLLDSLQNVPEGKDFYTSKVFWINFLAIVGTISAYFGFDFKAHNIDPEMVATIITTVVGLLNVYYRGGTSRPLNPIAGSIKKLFS